MPIYQSNMNYGLQGLSPGFQGIGEGIAYRLSPEGRQMRAQMEELTQYINPDGTISSAAPRSIKNKLEDLISQGRVYYDPATPGSFGILSNSEQLPQGMKVYSLGKTFYDADMWGPDYDKKQPATQKQQQPQAPYSQQGQRSIEQEAAAQLLGLADSAFNVQQYMNNPGMLQQARTGLGPGTPLPQFQPQPPQQPQQQPPNIGLPTMSQPPQGQPQSPIDFLYRFVQPPVRSYEVGGQVEAPSTIAGLLRLMNLERGEVPIIAHEGEHVMNREAVQRIGPDKLDAINRMAQQMPRYETGGGIVNWTVDQRKKAAETAKKRREESNQSSQPKTQQPPGNDIMGLSRVAQDMPTKDDEVLKEIGRQVVEKLTGFVGSNAPEQGYNRVAGVPDAQPRGEVRRTPTQASGRPTNVNTGGATRSFPEPPQREKPPMHVPADATGSPLPPEPQPQPNPQPKPPVNPQKEDTIPKRGEGSTSEPSTSEQPQKSMARPFYRNPGAAQNINWEQLTQLSPGQAFQYLQQYANTQGNYTNVNLAGREDPRKQMFQDLVGQYSAMKGIEDKVNQQKWADLINEQKLEQAKLEVEELKAISPFTTDLTKAKLNLTKAQTRNLLAQSLAAEEEASRMFNIDPAKLISAYKSVEEIKDKTVDNFSRVMTTSLQLAKESGSDEAWKRFYESKLMYDVLVGAMSPYTSYEEAVKMIGEGPKNKLFSSSKSFDKTLSQEEYETVISRATEKLMEFQKFDSLLGGGGQNVLAGLLDEINYGGQE